MPRVVQNWRTETNDNPPVAGSLLPGQLSVEMGTPTRLWVGVPTTLDATGQKLLYDSSAVGGGAAYVLKAGDTMTGALNSPGLHALSDNGAWQRSELSVGGSASNRWFFGTGAGGEIFLTAKFAGVDKTVLFSDGVTHTQINGGLYTNSLDVVSSIAAGGNITTALEVHALGVLLASDPILPMYAVTKQYCDANSGGGAAGTYVLKAGDTMTGALIAPYFYALSPAGTWGGSGLAIGANTTDHWVFGTDANATLWLSLMSLGVGVTSVYFDAGGSMTAPGSVTGAALRVNAAGFAAAGDAAWGVLGWDNWNFVFQRATGRLAWNNSAAVNLWSCDPSGNTSALGGVYASNTVDFGFYSTATHRIFDYLANQWAWLFDLTTGNHQWNTPLSTASAHWNLRVAPNVLAFCGLGPTGGVGPYVDVSDDRAKTGAVPATVGLAEVLALEPIHFTRIPYPLATLPDDYEGPPVTQNIFPPEIGFSAQQVQSVIAEAVVTAGIALPDGGGTFESGNPSLGLTTTAILAAVVNAIKTLDQRLTAAGF